MITKIFKHIWVFLFGGCVHKWSPWILATQTNYYIDEDIHSTIDIQQKHCTKCSKILIRNIK